MDEFNDMIHTTQISILIRMLECSEFIKVLSLTGKTSGEDIYKTFEQFV